MVNILIENKEVVELILQKINDNQSNLCLIDSSTNEMIGIDHKLKKIIKAYYENKLTVIERLEGTHNAI